jgi:hypothetical protein
MVPVACTAEGVGSGRVARITCPGPKAPALVFNELSAFPGATALRWKTYRPTLPPLEDRLQPVSAQRAAFGTINGTSAAGGLAGFLRGPGGEQSLRRAFEDVGEGRVERGAVVELRDDGPELHGGRGDR